ncbi:diacylglycerol/lipid kinase family protein [Paramaledivibacter caminithermalis]|uniref:Diacylglycerol kinase (ATP) n=1 Tax=Paramaledivibacter caminithermalis (strain DSM 15212 / CIP 107654 / DViRD3) TaxID=1121301 RepID=A0A1M6MNK9_PARC5|nr:YegS/Rv2252/BmrU family lipid kinase [Paramaledivibacter caminithermalis]SHJ85095.1 diacylglycerol kinase (ATP) [Paramaledivibacter caminithermalis DSM 15212]
MKVKIINNPSSGRITLQKYLEIIVGKLVLEGVFKCVDKFDTKGKNDAFNEVMKIKESQYDLIISVGGDGTLSEVVNGVVKAGINTPITVLPAGTVNDFANYLNIPYEIDGICNMFRHGKLIDIDVCKNNDNYFINVAAAGIMTDVPLKATVASKTILGKFAYYAEGIKDIPKKLIKSIKYRFEYDNEFFEEDVLLFAVLNSSSAGGFKRIAPHAGLDDGKFDVCIFKKSDIFDTAASFLKILRGEHINNESVRYFQTDNLTVTCLEECDIHLDIDGEDGGPLPAKFEILPSALKFFIPNSNM